VPLELLCRIACALPWCGYLSPGRTTTDLYLAQQFKLGRASVVRFRQDALDSLTMLTVGARSAQQSSLAPVTTPADEVDVLGHDFAQPRNSERTAMNKTLIEAMIASAARNAEGEPRSESSSNWGNAIFD